jgi:hypothetical protein
MDRGLLVMVHTTATPAWSDLALSGVFVEILRRTVNLAGLPARHNQRRGGVLQPIRVLDGFGMVTAPDATVQPITDDNAHKPVIDSRHPPGLYGRPGVARALNIGTQAPVFQNLDALPAGAHALPYGQDKERDLMPVFLMAAFALFCLDWLAMILLQAGWRWKLAGGLCLLMILSPTQTYAQNRSSHTDVRYAGAIYLAYVKSGHADVDSITHAGLSNLAKALTERTAVEPAGVVALDPAKDTLAFFPLIYWPVVADSKNLAPSTLQRVQFYLDHGGTILFDTGHRTDAKNALRRLAGSLNIPPLIPMPKTHVLTHSFYLLREMPGLYDSGTLWVEDQSASGRDGVSSVIVGDNDWAGAWAQMGDKGDRLMSDGGQGDYAIRFGINLVMYALTGNYKSDQVHMKKILERLGE